MKRRRVIEAISDPTKNFLAFFLVGTLFFTVISDGISGLVWEFLRPWFAAQWGLSEAWFQAGLSLALVILLLILTYATNFTRWLKQRFPFLNFQEVSQVNVKPLERTYPGLIVAMSTTDNSPAEVAIRHHWQPEESQGLQHCWIICTDKSRPYANRLVSKLAEEGMTQTVTFHYGEYRMDDVEHPGQQISLFVSGDLIDDPNYIQHLVNCIYADAYSRAALSESDVIADYTGGTKGLTAGMVLACTKPERALQYISQIYQPPQIMAVDVSYGLRPMKVSRRKKTAKRTY